MLFQDIASWHYLKESSHGSLKILCLDHVPYCCVMLLSRDILRPYYLVVIPESVFTRNYLVGLFQGIVLRFCLKILLRDITSWYCL